VGTGRIGCCAIEILLGFGCRVLAFDPNPREELIQCGVQYMALDELLPQSDIVSLYVPLMPQTYHLIGARSISRMKPGAMLINTSRGGLVDTVALVDALKTGHIGSAGLDVYEEEGDYFFEDCSNALITDDTLARLLTFNNVIVTSHQAFLTQEALTNIVDTTLENIREYESGRRAKELTNGVCVKCSS
jgi:D-lactate dehydrogenase